MIEDPRQVGSNGVQPLFASLVPPPKAGTAEVSSLPQGEEPDMSLQSFLYVSHSTLGSAGLLDAVDGLVEQARLHNASAGLTGALLFTGTHFAQVLEGSEQEIDAMIERLRRDSRHDRMVIVLRHLITQRRFAAWSLAYFGSAHFVTQRIAKLVEHPTPERGNRIIALMHEFSRHS